VLSSKERAATMSENDYVREQIRRSGFPLEIEVTEILQTRKWEVEPSKFYYDHDAGGFREMDALAVRPLTELRKENPSYPYDIKVNLVVECKKREGVAWVFFPRSRDDIEIEFGAYVAGVDSFEVVRTSTLAAAGLIPSAYRDMGFRLKPKLFVPTEVAKSMLGIRILNVIQPGDFRCVSLKEKALHYQPVKLAKQEGSFHRDGERAEIGDALSGLAKATMHMLAETAEFIQADIEWNIGRQNPPIRLELFFPVLILDGKLKVWRKDRVSDIPEVLFQVQLHSQNYDSSRLVSVITKGQFKRWLTQFEKDADQLVRKILTKRSRFDEQVRILQNEWIQRGPGKMQL